MNHTCFLFVVLLIILYGSLQIRRLVPLNMMLMIKSDNLLTDLFFFSLSHYISFARFENVEIKLIGVEKPSNYEVSCPS